MKATGIVRRIDDLGRTHSYRGRQSRRAVPENDPLPEPCVEV